MQTDALKIAIAATWAAQIGYVSLHGGDPGTTGANELAYSGYAREVPDAPTAGAPGVITIGPATFDVPDGTTVAYVGFWGTDGTTLLETRAHAETYAAGQVEVTATYTYVETP